jgi:hypothetical protein
MAETLIARSVPIHAEITLREGRSILAQLAEMSSLGCHLGSLEPIPIGTEFGLRITDGISTCELRGKVIDLHPSNDLGIFGMSVQLGKMAPEQRSVIDAWAHELACKRSTQPCNPCSQRKLESTAIHRASVANPRHVGSHSPIDPLEGDIRQRGPGITTVSHSTSCQSNLYPRIGRALAEVATSFCRSSVKRNRTAQRVTCVSWPETSL